MKVGPVIAILDYGMGNIHSIYNALTFIGADARIVGDPKGLKDAGGIVLPGVGAFGDGIRNLRRMGFEEALSREVIEGGKPFLGICLGLQLLGSVGFEHGRNEGLGWIKGVVERFPASHEGEVLRVPHIGWNDVTFLKRDGLYSSLGETQSFYFVHSYVLRPDDPSVVSGTCSYGIEFAASVESGNISAVQFHPEKSHKSGLAVLKNFLDKTKG